MTFTKDPACPGTYTDGPACSLQHESLRNTYGFRAGDVIQIRARAHNVNGWGGYSQVNTGLAVVQDIPTKMKNPTEGSATSIN